MNTIFGGDTGLTYEEVQKRRKIAERLRAANTRTPQNIGQGIHAIARAISGKAWDKTAAEGEKKLQDEFDAQFANLAGGLGVGGGMTPFAPSGASAPSGGAPALGVDDQRAMRTRGEAVPTGGMSAYRDAIASIESAGSGDYKAIGPVVSKGSYAGDRAYGRYQVMGKNIPEWTQRALGQSMTPEQFLANPTAQDAVFDHYFGQSIKKYGTPQDAASVWFTGQPVSKAGNVSDGYTSAPEYVRKFNDALGGGAAPVRTASAGGLDPVVAQLAQLASNPIANPGQRAVLNALLQQRMQASDPMRQLQMQKMQADNARMNAPAPQAETLTPEEAMEMGFPEDAVVQRMPDGTLEPVFMPAAPKPTSAEQQYRLAQSQGYEGSFMDFQTDLKRAGASSTQVVNNMGAAVEPLGTKGQILVPDPSAPGGYRVEVAEGSEMAREIESQQEKAGKATEARSQAASIVMDEIDLARELIKGQTTGSPATGITGGLASTIDSTRAGALKNRLSTIKANIGFDKLQAMRDASPTGGALGQVSEFENRLLQAVFGSLEQSQKADDLLYNLKRLEGIYNRIVHEGIGDDEARALYKDVVRGRGDAPKSKPQAISAAQARQMTYQQAQDYIDAHEAAGGSLTDIPDDVFDALLAVIGGKDGE